MKFKTIKNAINIIKRLLKLEAALTLLVFLTICLTPENSDTHWRFIDIIRCVIQFVIGTALLYTISIGTYCIMYDYRLKAVLNYKEQVIKQIETATDIGSNLDLLKISNPLKKEMLKTEIEASLNLGTLTYKEIHTLTKMAVDRLILLERTNDYLDNILDYAEEHELSKHKVNKLMADITPYLDKDINMFDISNITRDDIAAYKKEISIKHKQNLRFDAMTAIIKDI